MKATVMNDEKPEGLAVRLGAVSVSQDGTKSVDIKKIISDPEGAAYLKSLFRADLANPAKVDAESLKAETRKHFNAFNKDYESILHNHGDAVIDYIISRGLLSGVARENTSTGWRDIESAPDGRNILVADKIFGCEKYYEPEIAYRNGDFWFYCPDQKAKKPDLWMPLPQPPAEANED